MPSPSKRHRPKNLDLDLSREPSSPADPVSILKSRNPTQQSLSNPKAPTARSRTNPPVSRRTVQAPPSPIRAQRADDHHPQPSTFPSDPRSFEAEDANMSNRDNDFVPRDSHDLSLANGQPTRDSLMANMLLSLDQLTLLGQANTTHMTLYDEPREGGYSSSYGPGSAVPDERTWTRTSKAPRPTPSSNYIHNHSYSYSSDLEVGDDAARITRGRRSNSSSNYHRPGPSRMSSMRESTPNSQPSPPRRLPTRGDKGSKSSSSNSMDAGYAQVIGSQRWAQGYAGRSSSFDYGNQRPDITQRPWQADFPESFLNDDYDAAPTPTVPGGPRRIPPPTPVNNTFVPPEPPPEPKTPTLERKRSGRSIKSLTASGRKGADSKFNMHREAIPPLPSFGDLDMESAPSPRVGYEKAKEAPLTAAPPTTSTATPQPKEKPGFFRRVFGSRTASATTNTGLDMQSSPSQFSTYSNDSSDRPGSTPRHVTPQTNREPTPPSREASAHPPNTLQKKPSSFFRRRKKSSAEPNNPPVPSHDDVPPVPTHPLVLPVSLEPNNGVLSAGAAEPSPASSLRKVMSPYLRANGTPAQSPLVGDVESYPTNDTERYQRDFSPDYERSPNATIRPVQDSTPSRARPSYTNADTAMREPPEAPSPSETRNNSFLNLDPPSDTEWDVVVSTKSSKGATTTSGAKAGSVPAAEKGAGEPARQTREKHAADLDTTDGHLAAHDSRDLRDDTFRPIRRRIRAALEITDSEEDGHSPTLALPIEGARSATGPSVISSASGAKPTGGDKSSPAMEGESPKTGPKIFKTTEHMDTTPIDEPHFVVGDPSEDDRQKAQRIFDGNEDFIQKDKAAAWMGAEGPVRQRTLRAYMELYDFSNLSILASLREICGRLVLRGETQQVDRILAAFSTRWADCNPNHGFKSTDAVHTICYSIMLLNTDLHMADIEQKMTRGQFIKNTLATIQQAHEEPSPEAAGGPGATSGNGLMLTVDEAQSSTNKSKPPNRFSFIPPSRTDTDVSDAPATDSCGPLVKTPFDGNMKAWEGQVEIVLKDIYASIRDERLPLFGAETEQYQSGPASQSNLSVMGMLKRTPSVLSKAPSEGQSSMRGRIAENSRTNASRWASKSRSRHRLAANGFSSSRTSFDDNNSMWSPSSSSATWSRQSLGRTHVSMSMDSFGSSWPRGDYQQSIGFANALSQAIIREDVPVGKAASIMSEEVGMAPPLLEDESLELAGPPWVKEGIVTHKHHLDGIERKAKDRQWTEVFAVVQKGTLSLFSFTPNKSLRNKARSARNKGGQNGPIQVGGGNWQENATNLGSFNLRQSLASALPSPGYSRSRPHVWALSLPTGAVHLFQVGTPEIIKEFVTTANYWSARLSTHPLVGGISNIEYGWGEAIVNNPLAAAVNEANGGGIAPERITRPGSSATTGPGRASMQSGRSFRSGSFDYGSGGPGSGGRHKLPSDRIHIAEWAPPTQSMRASNLGEEQQLRTLEAYVKSIEEELQAHNQLRSPMLVAFSPRGHNAAKAMANWERKSAYLLREIVKFRTYVDCLQQADVKKREIYQERDERNKELYGEGGEEEN
ncbi:related to SEC7, component of non-clathrin vesicle coat [Cephalotrichum gorgonifer]|uniref:Related to SEC7, component of non-clathrin vesicle coat n=1 Tax=Cephalotrichum gorgonifer TaxID=2041049 RepID=A0AAE8SW04_9PEZI|nr:related to SEC7, component of non-clathrin vesicle coat [Cephalotrichum gorgonifer]